MIYNLKETFISLQVLSSLVPAHLFLYFVLNLHQFSAAEYIGTEIVLFWCYSGLIYIIFFLQIQCNIKKNGAGTALF